MKLTDTKIIISGPTLESYQYRGGEIAYGFTIHNSKLKTKNKIVVKDEESKQRKLEARRKAMQRARSTLRRIINCNAWRWKDKNGRVYLPVFVTLTFKESIKDIKIANDIFNKFIKRLAYKQKKTLKYVVVTEFQDKYNRGVIHYHAIFFNLPYIWGDDLAKIWKHGFIDIIGIDNVTNIGAYVCKYMSKEFEDDRLDGKKRYFASRGLLKPLVIKNKNDARNILSVLPKQYLKFEKEFVIEEKEIHVKYSQYQVRREVSFSQVLPELRKFL